MTFWEIFWVLMELIWPIYILIGVLYVLALILIEWQERHKGLTTTRAAKRIRGSE